MGVFIVLVINSSILLFCSISEVSANFKRHDVIPVVDNCVTQPDEWKCCATSPRIKNFTLTACVDLEYLRQDLGMRMEVTFNNISVFEEEISLRNPPPVCDDVPYLEDIIKVCLRMYNISIDKEKNEVSGCFGVEGKVVTKTVVKYKIGCFHLPIKTESFLLGLKKVFTNTNNVFQKGDNEVLPSISRVP